MDVTPCTYTGLTDEGAVAVAKAMAWKPPKGHASWCRLDRAPWQVERGWMHARVCTCAASTMSKTLRRINDRYADLHPFATVTALRPVAEPVVAVPEQSGTVKRIYQGTTYDIPVEFLAGFDAEWQAAAVAVWAYQCG